MNKEKNRNEGFDETIKRLIRVKPEEIEKAEKNEKRRKNYKKKKKEKG